VLPSALPRFRRSWGVGGAAGENPNRPGGLSPVASGACAVAARAAREPVDGPVWVCEVEVDRFRVLAFVEPGRVRLASRNGNTYRGFDPRWRDVAANARARETVLNGDRAEAQKRRPPPTLGPCRFYGPMLRRDAYSAPLQIAQLLPPAMAALSASAQSTGRSPFFAALAARFAALPRSFAATRPIFLPFPRPRTSFALASFAVTDRGTLVPWHDSTSSGSGTQSVGSQASPAQGGAPSVES
jgi:hypothetical protein